MGRSRVLIDFAQPIGLLLSAVLHFISHDDDPWQIMSTLRNALKPGSYIAISHATDERNPAMRQAAGKIYKAAFPPRVASGHRPTSCGFSAASSSWTPDSYT